jgi:hypothetical protein
LLRNLPWVAKEMYASSLLHILEVLYQRPYQAWWNCSDVSPVWTLRTSQSHRSCMLRWLAKVDTKSRSLPPLVKWLSWL